MASVSFLGIGGTDHLNSFFEGELSRYYSAQMAEDAARLQYQYAKDYAINGPTWQREGLEKAGINPLFAYGGSGAVGVQTPLVSAGSYKVSGGNVNANGNPLMIANAKEQLEYQKDVNREQKAIADQAEAESKVATLKNNLMYDVLSHAEFDGNSAVDVGKTPYRDILWNTIINNLRKDEYLSSPERQQLIDFLRETERVVNTGVNVYSAGSASRVSKARKALLERKKIK